MNFSLKNIIRAQYIRRTRLYKETMRNLREGVCDENALAKMIAYSKENVKYYHEQSRLYNENDYQHIPILRKGAIANNELDFVSKEYNPRFLHKKATGGTSGVSLNLYKAQRDIILETAFIDHAFSLIAPLEELNTGILRGVKPDKGLFGKEYGRQHLLSSYDLTPATIADYVDYINRNKINCLSAYPTSITVFCKQILHTDTEPPKLKGIMTSSEVLTAESKRLIRRVFPEATLVDLFGQSEQVAFALSINDGPYHFYEQYGHSEFIETGERLDNGNRLAEIVSTGLISYAMPFIKYGTDDQVELDAKGRPLSIIGRAQDYIISIDRELIPCIVSNADDSLANVITSQFYQDTIGEVAFRVVVNDKYSSADEAKIMKDLMGTFGNRVRSRVEVVESNEKTPAGKQKDLVQKLDISKF